MHRSLIAVFNNALMVLIMSCAAATLAAAQEFPSVVQLPDGFQPEGIAIGQGTTAYVSSLAGGSIYEIDLRTGIGGILVPGPGSGTQAVGLDFDKRTGYLFVAGGSGGDGRVYDTRTGGLVAQATLGGGFVNDVVVTREGAFFTDSFVSVLYKWPLDPQGMPSGSVQVLSLGGDYEPAPGFNANGIVARSDGSSLIIAQSNLERLYAVDPTTGTASQIDLGGDVVTGCDGLVLSGKSLYVVQNVLNQIAEFTIDSNLTSAALTRVITSSDFDVPSSAARFGPWLYVVNARFGTPPGPTVSYNVVRVQ